MSRPDPIEYAERLYAAIRAANFSPISFLAFGNAVKEGIELRRMTRIAVEPFMRVVGEMLELEEEAENAADILDGEMIETAASQVVATGAVAPAPTEQEPIAEGLPLTQNTDLTGQ